MENLNEHVSKLLAIPQQNVANTDNEVITNKGTISLFVIGSVTREIIYRYATISSQGNINFHVMSPFNFIDDQENNPQYAKKTVYTSVNTDSQAVTTDNVTKYYNQNLGNFLLIMKPFINHNGKQHPNIYNMLSLHSPVIKQALIPSDIDNFDSTILNAPLIKLQEVVQQNNLNEDLDKKERVELNVVAYKQYAKEVLELHEEGLLEYSNILINPTPNSISFHLGLENSMKAMSNPWLNINVLSSLGLPFTKVPVLNQYRTTVQFIETEDLALLYSDNDNMIGKRQIYMDEGTGRKREALSFVGIIKDYNSDTPLLVNITDPNGQLNGNSRGRVEAFEALLAKGINTFTIEGSLRPIVRLTGSNASRNGNIFWEFLVSKYSVYKSTSLRNSLESDSFADLSFTESDGLEEGAESLVFSTDNSVDKDSVSSIELGTNNSNVL